MKEPKLQENGQNDNEIRIEDDNSKENTDARSPVIFRNLL